MSDEKTVTAEEAEIKSKKLDSKTKEICKAVAERYEHWLKEHEGATDEEKHNELMNALEASVNMALLSLALML